MIRILVICRWFPEPDSNSGDLRQWEMLRILLAKGCHVTFLSEKTRSAACISSVKELGCQVIHDENGRFRDVSEMGAFLNQEKPDIAILGPYDVFERYDLAIRRYCPATALILDTVDLHTLRLWRREKLNPTQEGTREASNTALHELTAIRTADAVWVVSAAESRLLRWEASSVSVVPNVHSVATTIPEFGHTKGIVFLGGYDHKPNVDAVHFFHEEMLPLIRQKLGNVPVSYAGSNPPGSIRSLHNPRQGVVVTGYVKDHRALLGAHRVAIAPLRYGAGIKGKVGEYLSCGIPSVLTSVAAEGMHLENGKQAMIADDPATYARAVIQLHEDQLLWNQISAAGLLHAKSCFSPEVIGPRLQVALSRACRSARWRLSPMRQTLRRLYRLPRGLFNEHIAENWLRDVVRNEA